MSVAQRCAECANEGVVGINGFWYCADHMGVGFAAAFAPVRTAIAACARDEVNEARRMELTAGWWLCPRCKYSALADPQRPAPICAACAPDEANEAET